MKVLVVEDELRLARLVKQGLEEYNFQVDMVHDGEEGLHMAEEYPYDAVVLDINLPGVDGMTILARLRERQADVPVLLVTARTEIKDRIHGLDTGADDYIPKPFDMSELIARIRSAIRRSKGKPSPRIEIDDLEIDTNTHAVKRGGVEISLSAREFSLLQYLAMNSGRIVSRPELLEHIYATDVDWESNVIDVYITYLRRKIDKGFGRPLIHTVRGSGYMMKGVT